ncbi:MAG: prolyl oligopeptidase family serine peptidase [Bacilli bacterium]
MIHYESLLTPKTTFGLDLLRGARVRLQEAPVPGGYAPSHYRQERLWATAEDGSAVPMVAVYRAGLLDQGPAPLILHGYGSYGANSDPHFDPIRLPLLDLGVMLVTAQVRGGSEMGYSWYENGKLLQKRHTFSDFIAVAQDLIQRGYTTPARLAARGGSAGGLLMGAVANMAGHLFQAIAPSVPFVDVVTTMLDATIPLTSLEWDEWGNPEEPAYYAYMKSYSPYDNVEEKSYPHMLVTTGLNDPRVAYWEPAKWVARLRAAKTDGHVLLLKTNMGAGHFGASGRFDHLKELAASYAFILDKIGIGAE